ncbi:helix-turn-helix domain-containing protein [Pseudonocardia humida]|uniref:Helix-turn-helix domain-containing protein n=1 Tax=Pseudonocardia humida TaxID=2800819 RepID=A0ABT1ABE7_9PSEU|nr:helix-turn-helix domain-containing protein [Pseudonocardia humida]MCO1660377.1 helix-turn-helix domain-containing protein [Pseudonocardia humida]
MADHPRPGVRYLTSAEVARHLGVAPRTVGKWPETGLITPTSRTLGGHSRFLVEDVDRQAEEIRRRRGD